MDLIQIAEMKNKIIEELRQIDGLKQSMENTLAGLVQWERHLQISAAAPAKIPPRKPVAIKEVQPKPPEPVKAAEVTPSERVDKALAIIRGEFTRSELLAETEGDGKGGIGTGTFSNIFSRLLKREYIQCVKGSPGRRDSLYVRSGERKPTQGPPSQGELVTE
jgi:hypothetical protein